jgi:hypothetical protein
MCAGGTIAAFLAVGIGLATTGVAAAQPDGGAHGDTTAPGPVDTAPPVQMSAPTSDNANPAAVTACGQFGDVLDATSTYYSNFADALEESAAPDFGDPYLRDSNTVGRTALRQGAAVAMTAANTPGLPLDIANPMRSWSLDATKLLVKMGLRGTGETLNTTVTEMNNDATAVQQACAAAGTHA